MLCPYKRHGGHSRVVFAAMPLQKNAARMAALRTPLRNFGLGDGDGNFLARGGHHGEQDSQDRDDCERAVQLNDFA